MLGGGVARDVGRFFRGLGGGVCVVLSSFPLSFPDPEGDGIRNVSVVPVAAHKGGGLPQDMSVE